MALDTNGKLTRRLIQKSSRFFMIYASLLMVIAAPVFYFVTQNLYIEDADEALFLRKAEYLKYYDGHITKSDIATWNKLNRDTKIIVDNSLQNDSIFYRSYYDTLHEELEPYRELRFPIVIEQENYVISTRLNLVETEDLIEGIFLVFTFILFILVIGIFLLSRRLSNTLWRPFYNTLTQMEKFELDKNEIPQFEKTDIEEFVRFNQSIDILIQKNRSAYLQQKEFLENAAHELQTPLAVLQSKVDSLLQTEQLSNEQAQAITGIHESIAKLNRLNKNLLLLSRIDNRGKDHLQSVDIGDIITHNIAFFRDQAALKNITISITNQDNVRVYANSYLAESMVNNLMMNAIKHNVEGGNIHVELIDGSLVVSNTGQDHALLEEKLFHRFSKQGSEQSGSGLGLAIIKKIAELFDWSVQYQFIQGLHVFRVKF